MFRHFPRSMRTAGLALGALAWAVSSQAQAPYPGSGAHLVGELFAQTAGLSLTHVPYKGMAPTLAEMFSGQVSMAFDSMQTMMRRGSVRWADVVKNADIRLEQ